VNDYELNVGDISPQEAYHTYVNAYHKGKKCGEKTFKLLLEIYKLGQIRGKVGLRRSKIVRKLTNKTGAEL